MKYIDGLWNHETWGNGGNQFIRLVSSTCGFIG